jgi:DNA-binding MarR family transcriptional regulator
VQTDADYQSQAAFHYALHRFMRVSEENARAAGLTPQQYLLLLAVRWHPSYPAVPLIAIAEYLQLRQSAISLLITRAVKHRVNDQRAPLLVRGHDVNDRRRALIALTPEGEEILTRVMIENRRILTAVNGLF